MTFLQRLWSKWSGKQTHTLSNPPKKTGKCCSKHHIAKKQTLSTPPQKNGKCCSKKHTAKTCSFDGLDFEEPSLKSWNSAKTTKGPGEERMGAAYDMAKDLVRDRLANEDQATAEMLESMDAEDIVVVDGCYDHIHEAMERSGLPFTRVSQQQLLQLPLKQGQTVYVNCSSDFPPRAAHRLAEFVEGGGQLITTDWALKNVLEVGFPGFVEHNGQMTGDECVPVEVCNTRDEMVRGLMDEQEAPTWWLESSSYPIRVLDKKNVEVLVQSRELRQRHGEAAVLVRFPYGKGEVYHLVSHIYLQRSETRSARQQMRASEYCREKGGRAATMKNWQAMESSMDGLDYSTLQSACNQTEMFTRASLKQKKKFLST